MVIMFTFVSVFVLLTLIVAIISNAHDRTKQQEDDRLLRERALLKDMVGALQTWQAKRRVGPEADDKDRRTAMEEASDKDRLALFRQRIATWRAKAQRNARMTKLENGMCPDAEDDRHDTDDTTV